MDKESKDPRQSWLRKRVEGDGIRINEESSRPGLLAEFTNWQPKKSKESPAGRVGTGSCQGLVEIFKKERAGPFPKLATSILHLAQPEGPWEEAPSKSWFHALKRHGAPGARDASPGCGGALAATSPPGGCLAPFHRLPSRSSGQE